MNKTPKAPPGLSAEGKRLWKAILRDWGITDAAHLEVLHVGLLSRDRAERCRVAIDRDGEAVRDRFGQVKVNPLLSAERDARSGFLAAIKVLGLDPSEVEV
jgi:phage terminase small subunit